ncbi:Fic family protein [Adlercreutzia sp. R7]|uniref:Fic family protein n=1 Tax=Adlercreutzia wanghongyangiae TaxID=3111451 RepID=A0ABU6IK70_9ACTN|nr:Fic family protein [Adlercreutzia sp. R7]
MNIVISYSGLSQKLNERGLTRTALAKELGISSRTMAKIGRGEKVSDRVLERMATFLCCPVGELCRAISSNNLLQTLRDEKYAQISGGLYHELQVRMTYNSNHIEGSRLSEDQTRMIFETNTVDVGEGVPVDDIIETVNHFRAIDYCIDTAEEPLTEDIVKQLHRMLKQGTRDSTLAWFAVGDYKRRPNVVGGRETVKPEEVAFRMGSLLSEYDQIVDVTIDDIVWFHCEFERIHPFQDGNGRVGRLIVLKECLRFELVPFIIEDSKKMFYYRGLSEWDREKGYLTDTCLDGQDAFKRLMSMFDVRP